MDNRERICLEDFKTTDIRRGSVRRFGTGIKSRNTSTGGVRRRKNHAGSMLTKLTICAAAVILVLGICAIRATSVASNDLNEEEGLLGRLKFVSIPGMIDVFGSIGQMEAPIAYTSVELLQDGVLARFISTENTAVSCVRNGVVIAVSEDPLLGQYVTVMHEDDISTTYYGLENITCENNQPLKKGDTIGAIGSVPSLYFKILKQGELQRITDYIDIDKLR